MQVVETFVYHWYETCNWRGRHFRHHKQHAKWSKHRKIRKAMGTRIEEKKSEHITRYAEGERLESSYNWHFMLAHRNNREVNFRFSGALNIKFEQLSLHYTFKINSTDLFGWSGYLFRSEWSNGLYVKWCVFVCNGDRIVNSRLDRFISPIQFVHVENVL